MGKLVDRLASPEPPLLWLDDVAYADRLLANGATPWLDPAAYVAFRRKALGLLQPAVNVVPIGAFARAWVSAHAELREAMSAKKRAVAPVRALVADEGLRKHLAETLRGLRAAFSALPMVLAMPSPRAWVIDAYDAAFGAGAGAGVEVGEDESDSCAVYVADLLRAFGESGVDAVLLEERAGAEPASAAEIGWYQPVLNVAAHYRWDLGLRLRSVPSAAGFTGTADGVAFVIAPSAISGAAHGRALSPAFWTGEPAPAAPAGGFLFAEIPADAVPETVLERLATLRA